MFSKRAEADLSIIPIHIGWLAVGILIIFLLGLIIYNYVNSAFTI